MSARRESIESSSSEEIQNEENQEIRAVEKQNSVDEHVKSGDDCAHKREPIDDPEQEFLLRLRERHGRAVNPDAVVQCVLGDLKSFSDLKPFLDFERKQTTAPEKLRNPAGHYRRTVQKFYETRAKRREWDFREQMRAIEVKLVEKAYQGQASKPACSLSRCNGTGELWDSDGFVSPCGCEWGQKLSPKVLEAFAQINALRRLERTSTAESAAGNSAELGATTIAQQRVNWT